MCIIQNKNKDGLYCPAHEIWPNWQEVFGHHSLRLSSDKEELVCTEWTLYGLATHPIPARIDCNGDSLDMGTENLVSLFDNNVNVTNVQFGLWAMTMLVMMSWHRSTGSTSSSIWRLWSWPMPVARGCQFRQLSMPIWWQCWRTEIYQPSIPLSIQAYLTVTR